jgi:hypothetical protein
MWATSHTTFLSVLGLYHLTSLLQFHSRCSKWQYFILFYDWRCSTVNIYHNSFTNSSIEGLFVSRFCCLNSAAMHIAVQIPLQHLFYFCGYIPVVLLLNHSFWRDLLTVFYNGCTNLHFHQQCTWDLFFPHPHSTSLIFLIIAIFMGWGKLIWHHFMTKHWAN